MDEDTFWGLIESARDEVGDPVERADDIAAALVNRLAGLSTDDLVAFERQILALFIESHRWDLWGAAYLVNGGCSDDGFDYFRGWLIAQGREVWDSVLEDPDSLADVLRPEGAEEGRYSDGLESEDMLAAAALAYAQLTGSEDGFDEALEVATEDVEFPEEPAGEEWDFEDEDEMRDRFPRLARVFLESDEEDDE